MPSRIDGKAILRALAAATSSSQALKLIAWMHHPYQTGSIVGSLRNDWRALVAPCSCHGPGPDRHNGQDLRHADRVRLARRFATRRAVPCLL